MGWQDDSGQHEGYVVGLVPRDWHPRSPIGNDNTRRHATLPEQYGDDGHLRELGLGLLGDHLHEIDGVRWIQAGCICGWRSPCWRAVPALTWVPSIVLAHELDQGRAFRAWERHIEVEVLS